MKHRISHVYLKHENCIEINCNICDGGLAICTVCECGEGELATECPGHKVHPDIRKLIYKGRIDYINGEYKLKR